MKLRDVLALILVSDENLDDFLNEYADQEITAESKEDTIFDFLKALTQKANEKKYADFILKVYYAAKENIPSFKYRLKDVFGSNFSQVNFSHASLAKEDFSGSNFTDAVCIGSDFSHVNFRTSNLDGATFRNADLREAQFADITMSNRTDFRGAITKGMTWLATNEFTYRFYKRDSEKHSYSKLFDLKTTLNKLISKFEEQLGHDHPYLKTLELMSIIPPFKTTLLAGEDPIDAPASVNLGEQFIILRQYAKDNPASDVAKALAKTIYLLYKKQLKNGAAELSCENIQKCREALQFFDLNDASLDVDELKVQSQPQNETKSKSNIYEVKDNAGKIILKFEIDPNILWKHVQKELSNYGLMRFLMQAGLCTNATEKIKLIKDNKKEPYATAFKKALLAARTEQVLSSTSTSEDKHSEMKNLSEVSEALTGKKALFTSNLIQHQDLKEVDFSNLSISSDLFSTLLKQGKNKFDDVTIVGDLGKFDFKQGISFINADLTRLHFRDMSVFKQLKEGFFSGAKLNRETVHYLLATGHGKLLKGANLSGLDLSGLNFDGADLTNVDLTNTNLDGADLRNATLNETILTGIKINHLTSFSPEKITSLNWDKNAEFTYGNCVTKKNGKTDYVIRSSHNVKPHQLIGVLKTKLGENSDYLRQLNSYGDIGKQILMLHEDAKINDKFAKILEATFDFLKKHSNHLNENYGIDLSKVSYEGVSEPSFSQADKTSSTFGLDDFSANTNITLS